MCLCVCAVMAVLLKERITNGGMCTPGWNGGAAPSLLQHSPDRAGNGRLGRAGSARRSSGGGAAGVTDPLQEGGEAAGSHTEPLAAGREQPVGPGPDGGQLRVGCWAARRPLLLLLPQPPSSEPPRRYRAVRGALPSASPLSWEKPLSQISLVSVSACWICAFFFPSFTLTVPPAAASPRRLPSAARSPQPFGGAGRGGAVSRSASEGRTSRQKAVVRWQRVGLSSVPAGRSRSPPLPPCLTKHPYSLPPFLALLGSLYGNHDLAWWKKSPFSSHSGSRMCAEFQGICVGGEAASAFVDHDPPCNLSGSATLMHICAVSRRVYG